MKYLCDFCRREWDYPFKACIFCGHPISKVDICSYEIKNITKVFVPSDDHPIVPYNILFLTDSNGSCKFQKTFQDHQIGECISYKKEPNREYTIGVVGTGLTGRGIAEVATITGNKVILKGRSEGSLKKAIETISKKLSKSLRPDEVKDLLSNIILTTNFDNLAESDIIIESVIEKLNIKKDIFKKLDSLCDKDVILASNTSSLSISELSNGLDYSERIIGLHFFNPIPKMQLVEIIKSRQTSEATLEESKKFIKKLNKDAVVVKDTSGFIVNRLLFIMINEACNMIDKGVAKIEDIDKAMKLGANHPMGPFELADLIGLDLCLEIIENMKNPDNGKIFRSSKILKKLVEKGCYGRKSHEGFYKY